MRGQWPILGEADRQDLSAFPPLESPIPKVGRGITVGALGVLAFIFSAVLPHDDEIQQTFAQGTRRDDVLSGGSDGKITPVSTKTLSRATACPGLHETLCGAGAPLPRPGASVMCPDPATP
jgi:hypothetical protein